MLDVLVADCELLEPGDRFVVGGITYIVQGEPKRDSWNLTWRVDVTCV